MGGEVSPSGAAKPDAVVRAKTVKQSRELESKRFIISLNGWIIVDRVDSTAGPIRNEKQGGGLESFRAGGVVLKPHMNVKRET